MRKVRAVIRVYDATGSVIETHEHAADFKERWVFTSMLDAIITARESLYQSHQR